MALPFGTRNKPFTQKVLSEELRNTFESLPDARRGTNKKYLMSDAALSAFSVFFMQSPSFLAHQKTMQTSKGKNNAESLLGIHQIPSENQIRNLMDTVSPEILFPLFNTIFQGLIQTGKLDTFKVLDEQLLVALDGTEYYSSTRIHCPCCSVTTQKNKETRYYHTALTPVVLSPSQSDVIPLAPEFIAPQDGQEKQDCEITAAKRWLLRERHRLPEKVTILGDDLYCHQPWCETLITQGVNFILVCKPTSHQTLYEWIDDFERTSSVQHAQVCHWTGKQNITTHYRFMNEVPLRNSDDAVQVNWCEIKETDEQGRILYLNAFATNFRISIDNVADIVAAGRSRWKIENENNNTLKTKGYRFDHNFGHGKQHLSSVLATLIILSYLFHTMLNWFDECYKLLREALPSRQIFFDDIRALTRYMYFDDWDSMLEFMLEGLEIPIPKRVKQTE